MMGKKKKADQRIFLTIAKKFYMAHYQERAGLPSWDEMTDGERRRLEEVVSNAWEVAVKEVYDLYSGRSVEKGGHHKA